MLSGLKPLILLVGVAAAVAAGVGVMLWSVGPTYSLLYANLSGEDASQITQALDSAANSLQARRRRPVDQRAGRATRGRATQARRAGPARKRRWRECHDQGSGLRRQRLHGERALSARARDRAGAHHRLAAERAGRARAPGHGRQSAFVSDRRPGSASVFLQIKAGRRLDDERSRPSPISSLPAFRKCRPRRSPWWTRRGDCCPRPMATATRPCATRCSSSRIGSKNPMRSASRRCSRRWSARAACARRSWRRWTWPPPKQTREQYNPQSQVVRSESAAEEAAKNGAAGAGGVPGALTNQPPQPGVALPPGAAPAAAQSGANPPGVADAAGATPNNAATTQVTGPDSTSRQSTRNYEIDRTMAYTRRRPAESRACRWPCSSTTCAPPTRTARSPRPRCPRIRSIASPHWCATPWASSQARGDSVNVVNSSFLGTAAPEEGELESVPIWEKAWVQTLAKVLGRCHRAADHHLQRAQAADQAGCINAAKMPQLRPGALAVAGGAGGAAPPEVPAIAYEQQVAQARGLVAADPKRGAQVVKSWVSNDE